MLLRGYLVNQYSQESDGCCTVCKHGENTPWLSAQTTNMTVKNFGLQPRERRLAMSAVCEEVRGSWQSRHTNHGSCPHGSPIWLLPRIACL